MFNWDYSIEDFPPRIQIDYFHRWRLLDEVKALRLAAMTGDLEKVDAMTEAIKQRAREIQRLLVEIEREKRRKTHEHLGG